MDKLIIQLESILFLKGEPVNVSWLVKTLDKKEEEINISLEQLSKRLENRGVKLVRNGNEVVLATAPESAEILKSIVKSEFDLELSKASLETLSIILYKNTASRAEIDYIRGVNSSFILRNLLVRGLIEIEAKRGEDRNYVYKPSLNLLEHLGVKSLEELPDFASVSAKLKDFLNAEKGGK
ncbi:MAG: Segregation and condensation protein B [Parcubacteria group bacterium GW2011_GWB1_43_8]|nr:MAG: Segregation and condensation protein B [Parcubacteria group bacterium GW2011_GWB1_43_8]